MRVTVMTQCWILTSDMRLTQREQVTIFNNLISDSVPPVLVPLTYKLSIERFLTVYKESEVKERNFLYLKETCYLSSIEASEQSES